MNKHQSNLSLDPKIEFLAPSCPPDEFIKYRDKMRLDIIEAFRVPMISDQQIAHFIGSFIRCIIKNILKKQKIR